MSKHPKEHLMAKKSKKSRKSRKHRRKRGTSVLMLLLCILIAAAAVITAMTIFFKIGQIRLTGETRYTQQQVAQASGLEIEGNLILFDKNTVLRRIREACPYLDEVQVRRRLPDTVEILVTECTPVAAVKDAGGYWLMDREGKLLEKTSDLTGLRVPKITGLTLSEPKAGAFAEISEEDAKKPMILLLNHAEDDGILQDIGEIDFSQQYDIRLTYLSRFTVRLGSTEELEKKLRFLHVIVEEKLGANAQGEIDLSDPQKARFIPGSD